MVESEDNSVSRNGGHIQVGLLKNFIDVWSNCIRGKGQKFKDAAEFRAYAKNYAIATRRYFLYRKYDNEKVTLVCSVNKCLGKQLSWRIYDSRHKSDNLFGIRKCNLIHTCGDDNLRSRGHSKLMLPGFSIL